MIAENFEHAIFGIFNTVGIRHRQMRKRELYNLGASFGYFSALYGYEDESSHAARYRARAAKNASYRPYNANLSPPSAFISSSTEYTISFTLEMTLHFICLYYFLYLL